MSSNSFSLRKYVIPELTQVFKDAILERWETDGCATPSQLIEVHLRQHGWTQRVLALILGMNEQTVSRIMSGAKPIDAELALTLDAALGIEPERLLELQKSYELARAKIETRIDPNALAP